METEKGNKINLEEFMLHQLDWSLEMKARLESKATGYLAVTTLSLSLVFQMMMNSKVMEVSAFIYLCKATVIVGLLIVILCAAMLFPKRISYFRAKWLLEIYNNKIPADEIENRILKKNQKYIEQNGKTVVFLSVCSKLSSLILIVELALFIADCIYFFTL